jgi:hypothetical protein
MHPFRPYVPLISCLLAGAAVAQQPVAPEALRVYFDCDGPGCDFDYMRREITWVNWVRNRQDAQVHLLVASRGTGGGGREFTLRLIGLESFSGRDHELITTTPQIATDDERRRALAQAIRLGLAGYAASTGLGPRLDVTYEPPPEQRAGQVQQPRDPWNLWVFTVSVNGNFSGESRSNSSNVGGSLRASRTAEDWRMSYSARGSRRSIDATFEDGSKFESVTTSSGADAIVVRSLGDHWSVGVEGEFEQSDRENYDAAFRIAPGLEFNVWPYAQSSRRQLIVRYDLGLNRYNYADTTIFNQVKETRGDQRLTLALATREPWGSSGVSVQGATYLHDFSRNEISVSGGIELRVYKGLSLDASASYSRVRNQLNIAKGGASDEDVLLFLRELETAYRYHVSVGIRFTFGSVYNNIVNPRFRGDNFF